jgi:hypothetical protein
MATLFIEQKQPTKPKVASRTSSHQAYLPYLPYLSYPSYPSYLH